MKFAFTIPGRIGGKGRPRFVRATGRAYTPGKTVSMEALVKTYGSEAMGGATPLAAPVWLHVRIFLIPAKSWSKKKRASARHATGRPDVDNTLKLIGDALNGVCWVDDARISAVSMQRLYTLDGPERVEVRFGEFEDGARPQQSPTAPAPLFESNDGGARIGGHACTR